MNCKTGALQLIDQITDTIQIIPNEIYASPLKVFNDSTLGKHFRHIYDFFTCLIEQSDCEELDYADRKRDPEIEENKTYALIQFQDLKIRIGDLSEKKSIIVYADFQIQDGIRPKVNSSLGRELMYAYDHAVHHLAIVKIGIKSLNPDLPINKDMGIAASTIAHQYAETHGH